jgi:hypothetical protein
MTFSIQNYVIKTPPEVWSTFLGTPVAPYIALTLLKRFFFHIFTKIFAARSTQIREMDIHTYTYTERYLIQRLRDLTSAVKGETHLPETIQNTISELHHSSAVKVTSALQGSELCATWIHFPNMNI